MSLSVCIKKKFPGFTLDVSFEAGKETLGFLGESGCGKSLTLRCIAGVETPDEGRIVVNDTVFFEREAGKRPTVNLSPQERKTALLFQNYQLFPNLTVEDNIAAGISKKTPKDIRKQRVQEELKRFGLDAFNKRYPAQLSGGQQQRVALARMLAAQPGVLMLDEPFSALDAHLKSILEQNLSTLFDSFEGTILYVSHDIDEALRFCDRIAVVQSGKVVEIEPSKELVAHPQSVAGIKLSGCKNVTLAEKTGQHSVFLPRWGISASTQKIVPDDIVAFGVRAFYLSAAQGPGENCFRMKVDRASDSRFDRMLLLSFLDRSENAEPIVQQNENEMKYLEQRLFWRINKLNVAEETLPSAGEELWVKIPTDKVYLVSQ